VSKAIGLAIRRSHSSKKPIRERLVACSSTWSVFWLDLGQLITCDVKTSDHRCFLGFNKNSFFGRNLISLVFLLNRVEAFHFKNSKSVSQLLSTLQLFSKFFTNWALHSNGFSISSQTTNSDSLFVCWPTIFSVFTFVVTQLVQPGRGLRSRLNQRLGYWKAHGTPRKWPILNGRVQRWLTCIVVREFGNGSLALVRLGTKESQMSMTLRFFLVAQTNVNGDRVLARGPYCIIQLISSHFHWFPNSHWT
jgi:hypothetical protein